MKMNDKLRLRQADVEAVDAAPSITKHLMRTKITMQMMRTWITKHLMRTKIT